jgi:metal-sulfur cluster biosynthetic enzyme
MSVETLRAPKSRALLSEANVIEALHAVIDPELDEPITDLGFVRSVSITDDGAVEVHLRLPTSFCSPNFAYLMASDSKDAITQIAGARPVVVELDDHHDSVIINSGLATDAGYKGTFGDEADKDLEELRATFQRKAHTAAMERALSGILRERPDLDESDLVGVRVAELPLGRHRDALLRRREALGFPEEPDALVLVDAQGVGFAKIDAPLQLRLARLTRISIDGNAHFCRGLLRTRYPGSEADQTARPDGSEPAGTAATFVPVQSPVEERQP